MNTAPVDCPWKPWEMVDEDVVAQLTGRAERSVQRDRERGVGVPFKKLNGTTVRYRVSSVLAWVESQPGGRAATRIKRRKVEATS